MDDVPVWVLTVTIWGYWTGVGVMVARLCLQRSTLTGLVPRERIDRLMALVWTPLIAAWIALPTLAATRARPRLAVPGIARSHSVLWGLRWAAATCAAVCLLATIACWARMGRNWHIGAVPDQRTDLVTGGFYARVRHPIYAFYLLMMVCSVIIVPTIPMSLLGLLHTALIVLKARKEERFLLSAHGQQYAEYCRHTGRFFPRSASRDP